MLEQFRQTLPIYKYRQQLIEGVRDNQVIIIAGETGCGKTTQVCQYLYEYDANVSVLITQPRRVAAMTIAQRVAQEKAVKLGELVGYSVRFDDCYSRELTQIKFATDGMLIRELILDPQLKQYNVIIIDEAHERTVQSDLLLALLKQLISRRKDLKLIVMSATLEVQKFATYLKTNAIYSVEGRTFPIDIYNVKEPQADYIESTIDTILQVHFEEKEGDILAFLPGQEDIEDVLQILNERIQLFPTNVARLEVRPLYAALPPEVQMQAFEKTPEGSRKVVLSTNIAETSVTIDGIRFVVDCGYVKVRSYQHQKAIDSLLIVPISKAQAQQRSGRAGRQSRGKCYRLYTGDTFEKLARFMLPEILRTNLQHVILQMKAIGISNVLKFDFMDQPDPTLLQWNLQQLHKLGALDVNFQLTQHGRDMSQLPLEPQYAHFLLTARNYRCDATAVNIVAVMEVDNLFYLPRNTKVTLQKVINKFKVGFSDHLTKAKILCDYVDAKNKKSFCREYHLNQKALKKAIEIRDQLKDYLKAIKKHEMEVELNIEFNDELQRLLQCLQKTMIFKQATFSPADQAYRLNDSHQLAYIHPESVLFNLKQKPQKLIYNEVVMTKKVYLRDVTQIE